MTTDGTRLQKLYLDRGEDESSAVQTAGRRLKAAASNQRTLFVGGSLLASFVLFQALKGSCVRLADENHGAASRRDSALDPPDPELGAWAE